jgi:hypothetical protein
MCHGGYDRKCLTECPRVSMTRVQIWTSLRVVQAVLVMGGCDALALPGRACQRGRESDLTNLTLDALCPGHQH